MELITIPINYPRKFHFLLYETTCNVSFVFSFFLSACTILVSHFFHVSKSYKFIINFSPLLLYLKLDMCVIVCGPVQRISFSLASYSTRHTGRGIALERRCEDEKQVGKNERWWWCAVEKGKNMIPKEFPLLFYFFSGPVFIKKKFKLRLH